MRKIKLSKNHLTYFSKKYWFTPSDVLQRSIEAVIWSSLKFNSPVLDIGCGDGSMSELLFQGRIIDAGLDVKPKELKIAQKRGFYRAVVCANASKMPFSDNVFNTVISNSTFEHIEDDIAAVSEVARVLKKGGSFLFSVPNKKLEKVIRNIIKDSKGLKEFNQRLKHFNYRTFDEWESILNENGFSVEYNIRYFPEEIVKLWYRMFVISTTKIRNKELWSYLKDSKLSNYLPNKILAQLVYYYLLPHYINSLSGRGCQIFLICKKE